MPLAPQRNQLPPDRRTENIGAPSAGVDVGEYLEVGTDQTGGYQIFEAPGGGAWVEMPGERDESAPPDEGFYSNLAEVLPDPVKAKIVTDLLRKIESDKEARKKRDEQYEEGIRRTGLGKDAPGGAEFEGASRVVHPMMTEACVDYESRIIKELWPPSGPVKPKILGVPTADKEEKAQRKTSHMNWQITSQIKEARATMETTLTQVPLGGSQFIYQGWDHRLKRPRWEFCPIDDVYIPFNAADFQSATRRTRKFTISAVELRQRIDQGMYVDAKLPSSPQLPEPTKAEAATRKVQGVEDPGANNLDSDREFYETMEWLEVTDEMAEALDGPEQGGEIYPFLMTIDPQSRQMLSCYRDWEDGDEAREPIEHLFEFPFIPWRGAYSIGFPQIIGGLSAAATGALRALLDSAHANNASGGLILKGAGTSGQTRRPQVGEFTEIDGGMETDDIRKRVMPFSFNQPSSVLYELLGFLTNTASGVVRTSLEETPLSNSSTPVPVGTQMSRVEEGLVVFSAIHGRAHSAFNRLLQGLHRLNRLYLPDTLKVDAEGKELLVRRKDYEGPCDVQGVSDPTVYSDNQRFMQLNYMQMRQMAAPGLYNARAVELWGLKLMKVPDPDSLLNPAPEPHELNAVNENLSMALGQPVTVFPEQDHLAHLQVLFDFMFAPSLGSSPIIAPTYLPIAIRHAAEHIAYYYVQRTVEVVQAASQRRVADLMSKNDVVKAMFDRLLAMASQKVVPEVTQAFVKAQPMLIQAQQMAQQFMQKPPMDPAQAAIQAATQETQRKSADDQASHQLDAANDQARNQLDAQRNAIDAARVQAMRDNAALQSATRLRQTQVDAETAEDVAAQRAGVGAPYTTGASLNP